MFAILCIHFWDLFEKYLVKFYLLDILLMNLFQNNFRVDINFIDYFLIFETLENFLRFLRLHLTNIFFQLFALFLKKISVHVKVLYCFFTLNFWIRKNDFENPVERSISLLISLKEIYHWLQKSWLLDWWKIIINFAYERIFIYCNCYGFLYWGFWLCFLFFVDLLIHCRLCIFIFMGLLFVF